MNFELGKAWYEKHFSLHDDYDVSAGVPYRDEGGTHGDSRLRSEPSRAFGTLVAMLRREQKLTVEQFAFRAKLSAGEIQQIESDPHYVADPSIVRRIAQVFDLPASPLLELSRAASLDDGPLHNAAIRFADKTPVVLDLTDAERLALSEFVNVLKSHAAD